MVVWQIFLISLLLSASTSGAFAKEYEPDFDIEEAAIKCEMIYSGECTKTLDKPKKLACFNPDKYYKGPSLSHPMPVDISQGKLFDSLKIGKKYIVFVENGVPIDSFFTTFKCRGIIPYSDSAVEKIKKGLELVNNIPKLYNKSESVILCSIPVQRDEQQPRLRVEKFYKGPPLCCDVPVHRKFVDAIKGDKWFIFIENCVPVDRRFQAEAIPYSEQILDEILKHMEKMKGKNR